jgi:hypothetical protein
LAVACLLALTACAFEKPLHEPFDSEAVSGRTEIVDAAGMTREQVRMRLGAPWIADEARRVDLYRLSGKQRRLLVVLAPYPVPLPSFSHRYLGYTLVSYAADGHVDGADSAFVIEAFGEIPTAPEEHKPIARAGDYSVVHPSDGREKLALSVSLERFLKDRPATARNDVCTVLIGCAPRPASDAHDGFCWPSVRVDDGAKRELLLRALWVVRPPDATTSSAGEPPIATAGGESRTCTANHCVVEQSFLVPLELAPGKHHLRLGNRYYDGQVHGELSCRAGELLFAQEHGEITDVYSMSEQLSRRLNMGRAQGAVEFTSEPPPALAGSRVLLNQGGKWLLR